MRFSIAAAVPDRDLLAQAQGCTAQSSMGVRYLAWDGLYAGGELGPFLGV